MLREGLPPPPCRYCALTVEPYGDGWRHRATGDSACPGRDTTAQPSRRYLSWYDQQ